MKLRTLILWLALLLVASSTSSFAYVLGPTTPGKWGDATPGTGATVTYSYMPSGVATDDGVSSSLSSFMPSGFEAAIEAAFNAWSAVANITFTQVADCGAAWNAACGGGEIRIGGHAFDGAGGVLAHGYFAPVNGNSASGDIHFDIAENWNVGFGPGVFDIFLVMAHEIGHAIGLDHSFVAGALMNPLYPSEFIDGPQADDIAGAQYLYGAPLAVPIPAAFPLFGTALLAMGLIGWRSRRRAAA